jgi:hypothetical protein
LIYSVLERHSLYRMKYRFAPLVREIILNWLCLLHSGCYVTRASPPQRLDEHASVFCCYLDVEHIQLSSAASSLQVPQATTAGIISSERATTWLSQGRVAAPGFVRTWREVHAIAAERTAVGDRQRKYIIIPVPLRADTIAHPYPDADGMGPQRWEVHHMGQEDETYREG